MFLASKYEDIQPLMMRTIINKIGHCKFTNREILARELEMLRTLEFRVGSPTALEFLDQYRSELTLGILLPFKNPDTESKLMKRILMLSKLACCSYNLMQLPPSLLGAAILSLSVKLTIKQYPAIPFASSDIKTLIK